MNSYSSISIGIAHGVHFVFLKLDHPESHIQQLSPELQQHVIANGVVASADELSLDFNELKNLIEEYYHRYRS